MKLQGKRSCVAAGAFVPLWVAESLLPLGCWAQSALLEGFGRERDEENKGEGGKKSI